MPKTDFADLVNAFDAQSNEVKAYLAALLDVIKEGRVPSFETMEQLDHSVAELQKQYQHIYEAAKMTLPADELPAEGSSIPAFAAAVANSQAKFMEAQLERTRAVLVKFTNVKSLIDEFTKALAPYQSAASALLEQLSVENVEELSPQTEAPELFLKAMACDDLYISDGLQLMKQVQQHFPEMEIQMGLAGRRYFLSEQERPEENSMALQQQPGSAPDAEAAAEPLHIPAPADAISAPASDAGDTALQMPPEQEEQKGPVHVSGAGSGEAHSAGAEAVEYPITNQVKIGEPGVSAFKKEIRKIARSAMDVLSILPLFTNLGVLSKQQIYSFLVCMGHVECGEEQTERIFAAVDLLADKGYLASFENAEGTGLYCLSDYCCKGMQKESIRQSKDIFYISIGSVTLSAAAAVDRERADRFYRGNEVLLQYLVVQQARLTGSEYLQLRSSIRWHGTQCRVTVFYKGAKQQAVICQDLCDLADSDAAALLIPQHLAEQVEQFPSACECVFVIEGDRIRACVSTQGVLTQIEETDEADRLSPLPVPANQGSASRLDEASETDIHREKSPSDESEPPDKQEDSGASLEVEDAAVRSGGSLTQPSPEPLTPQDLLTLQRTPTDEEFCAVIHGLLEKPADRDTLTATVVNTVLLAKGAGQNGSCPVSRQLSRQLCLATRLLLGEDSYSSECLSTAFSDEKKDIPALVLAAYMNALLTPAIAYDYALKAQGEQYLRFKFNKNELFEELEVFKPLFNKLLCVRDIRAGGFTPAVVSLLGDEAESERFLNGLRRDANSNLTVTPPKTRMKALPILYNMEFGPGSDLYQCMEYIADGAPDAKTLELIDLVLADYDANIDGQYRISEAKIEEHLNAAWDSANSKSKFKLEYDARDLAIRQYRQRLTIMLKWAEHVRNRMGSQKEIERLRLLRKDILDLVKQLCADDSWRNVRDASILDWMLWYMGKYLTDAVSELDIYSDLLYTGVFSLDETGVPKMEPSLSDIKYYELWRNALRHIVAPRKPVEELTAEILGETSDGERGLKDNLHQLFLLGKLLGSKDDQYAVSEEQLREAAEAAHLCTVRFTDKLELAYTYYQINETEKETLAGIMNQYQDYFYETGDFACWRQFLRALESQIREFAKGRKEELSARLCAKLEMDKDAPLLREAKRLLEEDNNFAVTEEYLNRYESGERDIDDTILPDYDYFEDFLTPVVFDPIMRECVRWKGKSLKTFGWNYLESRLPKEWTNRLRENSRELVSRWPAGKNTATPEQVQKLLCRLGIDATNASKVVGKKEEIWKLAVRPTAKGLADYLHPIAAFGTKMKSPLQVIFLYGNYTERQLVDTVTSLNLGSISIVFIDRPIDAAGRRYIGEIFHTQKTGQNPFLLVDQVLLLYLAMHQETERLPAMLKCTLPYTTYQPFLRDGGSTADEMFCGRALELATIIDPNGASVVYGGRQLGKTALLERAESRCSKPEEKAFAVYSIIRWQKTETEVADTLVSDINRKTDGLITLKPCHTIREMCIQLSDLFRAGKIKSMHLLIDEVDDFLGAIAGEAYMPLQSLVDLKRETKNNFKFVIAGLHNVCRAKNATRANGIFGQLGTPLCIKPLSPTDALQLLSKPLRYLGFQIDRYPHLETILTNTNYYPGILQFFGYILVETLTGQYSKYYRAADGNPPFTLQDEQLGAVMNSADLNKSIKDKFRWSLELDPRYFMIARCITLLYHIYESDRTVGSWHGFSVDEVMGVAEDYQIHCLIKMSKTECSVLMDEMVEMGILGKPSDSINKYRLRRSSFVDIIGESLDVLESDIISNNTEA